MKNFALAALVALSTAPIAFSASAAQLLSNSDQAAVRQIVPGADLDNLSAAQEGALAAALYSSDRDSSTVGQIRAILQAGSQPDTARAETGAGFTYSSGNGSIGSDR